MPLGPAPVHGCGPLHPSMLDPWRMAATWGMGTVLAVLTATRGPAYRNAGAAMAIAPDGRFAGAITSGCIEADIVLRAKEVRQTGRVQQLHYGEGSPFFDLLLPCGGAVEIRLFRLRDQGILAGLMRQRDLRQPVSLSISPDGRLSSGDWKPTASDGQNFQIGFRPALRFLIFGTGAEAAAFSGLVRGAAYEHILLSHEKASLISAAAAGSPTLLIQPGFGAEQLGIDADTAAALFYHDHDHEPDILRQLVRGPAFYIGAQGSRATQASRLAHLREMGLSEAELGRVRGPIGVMPSAREPNALAISVLAEIVGLHAKRAETVAR